MAEGYWNLQPSMHSSAGFLKRPRSDYGFSPGMPSAPEMHSYLARDNDHGGPWIREAKTMGSAYESYLQNAQLSSLTSGEASNYGAVGLGRGGIPALPMTDPVVLRRSGAVGRDLALNGRGMEYGGQHLVDTVTKSGRDTLSLPPDASNTLYVEGLPSNCTRREVAHVFRPFVGYKEVRLVSKESKHRGGDPLILCFVDFIDPACAVTALTALQGYKMDEHDPDSAYLRLQFSKFPGARSGGSRRRGRR